MSRAQSPPNPENAISPDTRNQRLEPFVAGLNKVSVGRMMRRVGHLELRRVPGISGRRRIVVPALEGSRDLERETVGQPLGGSLHGRLRGVGWEGVFTLQTELERPAATGPTHHLLRSHCTICSDMTGADAPFAVGENQGLHVSLAPTRRNGEPREDLPPAR